MSIIMTNIRNGIIELYAKSGDAACEGDLELASEYMKAAEWLEDVYSDYIPMEGEL